jgi:hypothetical protein
LRFKRVQRHTQGSRAIVSTDHHREHDGTRVSDVIRRPQKDALATSRVFVAPLAQTADLAPRLDGGTLMNISQHDSDISRRHRLLALRPGHWTQHAPRTTGAAQRLSAHVTKSPTSSTSIRAGRASQESSSRSL